MQGLTEQPCRVLCIWGNAGAGAVNSHGALLGPECLHHRAVDHSVWTSEPSGVKGIFQNWFLFRTDDSSRFGSPVILQYLSALIWREGNPCHKPSDMSAVLSQAQMIQGQTRWTQFLLYWILRSVRSTSSHQLLCLSRMSSFLGDLSGLFTPFYTPPHHLTFPICKSTFFFN